MVQRLSKLLLGLTVATSLGAGVGGAAPSATAQELPNDIQVRLAGSPSIGQRMTTDAVTVWAKKIGLPSVRVNAGVDPDEYELTASRAESPRKLRVSVSSKGSSAGIEPLLRGQADLWMASNPVQASDLDAMRRRGIPNVPTLAQFQAPGIENVVGLDGLAIVTNPHNPVKRLAISQIKDMFQGRITNWSQVGGPNLPIKLYAMEAGAGYADVFCSAVIGNPDVAKCMAGLARLAAPLFTYPDDLSDQIADEPASLSFVAFQDKRNARPIEIGTACNTALDPDSFLIKTNEYPLTRRLYIYANPNQPLTAAARAYLDFLLSGQGQNAITMTGFATLSPSLSSETYSAARLDAVRDAQDGGHTRVRPPEARNFQEAIGGGDRLSVTLRFQSGTSELDSRAEADLGRLAATMALPANADKQVVLIGFSSAGGDYTGNRDLSRDRAGSVRERLASKYGIKDAISLGVGPAGAVACNLDPNYAQLNQRVEVWLRKRPGA